jgi:hypothetical protein
MFSRPAKVSVSGVRVHLSHSGPLENRVDLITPSFGLTELWQKTRTFYFSDQLVRAWRKLYPGYCSLVRSSYLLRLPKNVTM